MSYHQITIVGNLGRDPEMRYTGSGTQVTNFNVATNNSYRDSNGNKVDKTTWFRVTVWGRMAEVCDQYLNKGSKVLIIGELTADENGNPRIWTRQDGTPAASFEIKANRVVFLGSRRDNGHADDYIPGFDFEESVGI